MISVVVLALGRGDGTKKIKFDGDAEENWRFGV